MEYTVAAGVALEVALVLAAVTGVARQPAFWVGMAAFAVLTIVSDNALTGAGVFTFGGRFISGVRIGSMPVEDLLYGSALYGVAVAAYEWRWAAAQLVGLLRTSRPFSWINTAVPCLVCGIAVGRPTLALAVGTLYFLAPYNLLMYGINDAFDYESDVRNPRKGGVEGGLVPPSGRAGLWAAIAVSNLPFLAALAWLGGPIAAGVLALAVVAAIAYSAPPLRLKEVAGLDALTSALHFVLPCALGGLLAGAGLGALPWVLLLAFLLWGAASQALGAIQDIAFDREAGIGSIAVTLGGWWTAVLATVLYSAAVVLVASRGGLAVVAAVALLPYPLLAASCLGGDVGLQSRRAWKGFLGMNLLTGFLLTQVLLRAWGVGQVTVAELLGWGSAVGVTAVIGVFLLNSRLMRRSGSIGAIGDLSIVIPVRDEISRLGACLAAIPPGAEVIVADNGSGDGTAELARRLLPAGGRVVLAGSSPPGWTGKCWAAWVGAAQATRPAILFLDADTRLEPGALEVVAGEVAAAGGLVSFLNRYEMPERFDRALMPAFVLLQSALWPLRVAPIANGPLMAVHRQEYLQLGGHRAIATSDREDLDLALLFRSAGLGVRLLQGADLASTRHYEAPGRVGAAWRRMYYAYCGHSLAVALSGIFGLATVFLLPLLVILFAALAGDRPALAGGAVGTAGLIVLRLAVAGRQRQPLVTILWHPVTWVVTLFFMAASVFDGLRGRRPVWRGTELAGGVG